FPSEWGDGCIVPPGATGVKQGRVAAQATPPLAIWQLRYCSNDSIITRTTPATTATSTGGTLNNAHATPATATTGRISVSGPKTTTLVKLRTSTDDTSRSANASPITPAYGRYT